MKTFSGKFYDGTSSKSDEVDLYVVGDNLHIKGNNQEFVTKINDCIIEPPLKNGVLVIQVKSGWRIEIDQTLVASYNLEQLLNRRSKIIFNFENKKRYLIVGTILVVLSVMAFIKFGAPFISHKVTHRIPEKILLKLEENVIEKVESSYVHDSGLEKSQKVKLKEYLVEKSFFESNINIRSGKKRVGANAFALSAREIYITDELINTLEYNKLILAIYLHEEGHLKHRHVVSSIVSAMTFNIFVFMIVGDMSGITESLTTIGVTLVSLKHSRDYEREADQYAIAKLKQLGFSPKCFSQALKGLRDYHLKKNKLNTSKYLGYLSSHPNIQDRIDNVEKEYKLEGNCILN